ncbi:hypothetical protein D8674_041099 [Pyrus ussuriensis x Pyrus communis]|uniref:Uncharacterized protein n=1 Tax=Pyrus ussuriensis x Pyrus communis TaxID=2448454 RepID=A0A5N5I366_9ROSA|nr:hypothetical protein D8674_018631 [Pyrus ussuriensis x Pyrus communis]KAB2634279.1 hypothetical protein D8674_041099 [Pyrus ussuriensis x Pyrus communis]
MVPIHTHIAGDSRSNNGNSVVSQLETLRTHIDSIYSDVEAFPRTGFSWISKFWGAGVELVRKRPELRPRP